MKKTYNSPTTTVIEVKLHSHLLEASVAGVNMTDITNPIELGDPTTGADVRLLDEVDDYDWDY